MAPKRRLAQLGAARGSTRGALLDALEDDMDAGGSAGAAPQEAEIFWEREEIEEVEDAPSDRSALAPRPAKQPRCDAAVDFLTASADFLKKDNGCA